MILLKILWLIQWYELQCTTSKISQNFTKKRISGIVKTPTQPQLNLTLNKFGFYVKITWHTTTTHHHHNHHPPPPKSQCRLYLSCYWPDFDQIFKVGSGEHLEQIPTVRWHLSRQHLSWRHLSISAISQLLLALFWPNFKGRFLRPFWTYSNCNSDSCPNNICSCNICTYLEYLSC